MSYLKITGVVFLFVTFELLMFSGYLPILSENLTHYIAQTEYASFSSGDDTKVSPRSTKDGEILTTNVGNTNISNDGKYFTFQNDTRPPWTVPRVASYCRVPNGRSVGQEGLVTEDYTLLGVHVVIRHGDRFTVNRLPNVSFDEVTCLVSTLQHSLIPKVANFFNVMSAPGMKMPKASRFYKKSLYPSHSKCSQGDLTERGALQLILHGMLYNDRYFQKHGLFNETNWHTKVVAHTTGFPRTFQSAIAFLYGFLPSLDVQKLNLKVSNSHNFCDEKILGMACSCAGIDTFYNKTFKDCQIGKDYLAVTKKYKNVNKYIKSVLNARLNLHPYNLMDGLTSFACHNVSPPCNSQGKCITAKVVESVWERLDYQNNCFHGSENYRKFSKANIHRFLFRIARNMNFALENKEISTFHFYAGHDTTISPLITVLGLKDVTWPGFAYRMTFELYRRLSTGEHVIRILQDGKVVTQEAVFCRNKTGTEFCHFTDFYNHVTAFNLREFCKSLNLTTSI